MIRRIAAVLALALLPGLAHAQMIRYIQPGGGGTFTGGTITSPILAPAADNCSSVPYSFTGDTNTGVCSSAADTVVLRAGGVSQFTQTTSAITSTVPLYLPEGSADPLSLTIGTPANKVGFFANSAYGAIGLGYGGALRSLWAAYSTTLNATAALQWDATGAYISDSTGGGADLKLWRDAANTLALRNGTAAQKFIWNYSYTDGSNYAQGALKTSASGISIEAETAGSGADNLDITLTPAGTGRVTINGSGATIGDQLIVGGQIYPRILALADATMNNEVGPAYTKLATATASFAWTNAMVVALGASTTGDITVATLAAKTQVLDAAVVITGTAAGTTTLTVSCGDAVGGTPFTNYILPSDAKVAANTFYGDATAERGASLDGDPLVYLPSYTATTLVTCHFISTGANLDQVTGSTGRVILTTRLLP